MSKTIFCTFDQQDLADLAMGHIREIRGVRSIRYTVPQSPEPPAGIVAGPLYGSWGMVNIGVPWQANDIPRPATVRITCDSKVSKQVIARLVNLRATQIVSTP